MDVSARNSYLLAFCCKDEAAFIIYEYRNGQLVKKLLFILSSHHILFLVLISERTILKSKRRLGSKSQRRRYGQKRKTTPPTDSLTFISFQDNFQTAAIYFYSYHVIPLNKTISNYSQLASSNFIP